LVRFYCDFIMEFTEVKKKGGGKPKKRKLNKEESEDTKLESWAKHTLWSSKFSNYKLLVPNNL